MMVMMENKPVRIYSAVFYSMLTFFTLKGLPIPQQVPKGDRTLSGQWALMLFFASRKRGKK